jgi:cytochrome c556
VCIFAVKTKQQKTFDMKSPLQPLRPLMLLALIALAVYALSCAAKPAPAESAAPINPNGDSELALLMRAMYDDAAQMKAAIARGEQPVPAIAHEALLTAAATEPEKAASPTYQVFARSYLQTLKALEGSEIALASALFRNIVDSCMSCHDALCPGPKMRIQHLY